MGLSLVFSDSYTRVMLKEAEFFDAFYHMFFKSSEDIEKMFFHVDMENQKDMLKASLAFLLSYSSSHQASRYLIELADMHNNKLKVKPDMYLCWFEALMMAVKSFDTKFSAEVDAAWEKAFMPGIEFMMGKKHYT